MEKYKARLVVKEFTQICGVDYYETYTPVAKLASFRLLLAIAAQNGWAVHTFNFNSAYLNSELGDSIWNNQPDMKPGRGKVGCGGYRRCCMGLSREQRIGMMPFTKLYLIWVLLEQKQIKVCSSGKKGRISPL